MALDHDRRDGRPQRAHHDGDRLLRARPRGAAGAAATARGRPSSSPVSVLGAGDVFLARWLAAHDEGRTGGGGAPARGRGRLGLGARGRRRPLRPARGGAPRRRSSRSTSCSRSPSVENRQRLSAAPPTRLVESALLGVRARPRREVRQGRPRLRRRAARPGRVGSAPERRRHGHAADADDRARDPDRLGGDGHGHRGAPRDRARARGRARDHPPQPLDRAPGGRDRQGEAERGRHDRRAGHARPGRPRHRRARPDGALPRLGRADHEPGRRARRHPHEPRPPVRRPPGAARARADDEREPRHGAGRDDAGRGRAAARTAQDREAPDRRRDRAPEGA